MGFLKKIRSNILNRDNSFHVGFQNRSPFSYTSQYSGDWVPPVQSLKQNPEGWIDPTLGGEWSKATTAAIKAVGDIGTAVVKNLIPSREEKEKKEKEKKAKERRNTQYSKAFKKVGERIEERPEFVYEPTIPIEDMIPTTSTSGTNTYPNLYPDTPTKTTQDIKNEFNQKKCNFDGGTWDSTTNTCN